MKDYILEDWLLEADTPAVGGQPDMSAGQAPATDAMMGPLSAPQINNQQTQGINPQTGDPQPDINVSNIDSVQGDEDISNDPVAPDMPEQPEEKDFETWRKEYFKNSIKGDAQELIDFLNEVRDLEGLFPIQRKFVEDNFNIQLLRQNSNIDKASKDIRKNIKAQLDKNNPVTSVINHIIAVLDTIPTLNNIFIKTKGYGNLKGDLHRKYIAALLGGVQVGSGNNSEDIIFNDKEYSILISTRFNSEWGDVMLGQWNMKEDDPERYLSNPELKRLRDGSPEEKDVLRRRIILESIAKHFENRSFIINVVDEDGTIHYLGWDIGGSLRAAYTDGKLIVKTTISDNSDAFISDEGEIVPYMDLDIRFGKETGEQNDDGTPEVEELSFLEKRNGMLFLNADVKTIKLAADSMQGMVFKQVPYNGNPSDLKVLSRCVYSVADLVLRQC